jgi:hypothetical protein
MWWCRGTEDAKAVHQQLLEARRLMEQFSRENERLAALNASILSRRTLVDNDYKSALGLSCMVNTCHLVAMPCTFVGRNVII